MRAALGTVLARLLDLRPDDNFDAIVSFADRIEVGAEGVLIDALPEAYGWRPAWRTIPERHAIDGRNEDGTPRLVSFPAHRITAAEATEELAECGLWPVGWLTAEDAPRWYCDECFGRGFLDFSMRDKSIVLCPFCRGHLDPYTGEPVGGDTVAAACLQSFVAVASLSIGTLLRTQEMARIIARDPSAKIVWRAMTQRAIEVHHNESASLVRSASRHGWTAPEMFSREEYLRGIGNAAWPGPCPYENVHRDHAHAYAPMRTLAVGDGPEAQPTGVNLLDITVADGDTRGKIVLGVELIDS